MTTSFRFLAVAVCATVLAACTGSSDSGDVAATVNGTDIPRQVITDAVEQLHGFSELSAEEREELAPRIEVQERETLRLHIVNAILDGIIEERDIEVDEERVETLREDAIETAGSEEALRESVAEVQLSLETFNDVYLPQQAMIFAIRDDVVDGMDAELRTARHILVADEQTAQAVVERIEDGEDFGAVAEELSTDQGTAANGGELPPAQRGEYLAEFDEATWEAELGELVGPVETEAGYHIIEVVDEQVVPSDELDDQQVDRLAAEELTQVVNDAFESAEITVDPAFGEWDAEDRNVVPVEEVGSVDDDSPAPQGEDVPDGTGGTDDTEAEVDEEGEDGDAS